MKGSPETWSDAVALNVHRRAKPMAAPFVLGFYTLACLLIVFLLAGMVRCFRSPAFYNLIADVCSTLSAIEYEGQDGCP